MNVYRYLQGYSQTLTKLPYGLSLCTEQSLEVVPAGGSNWQPMDTFLFHRNYTRQTSGTAVSREGAGFVNSAVSRRYRYSHLLLLHVGRMPELLAHGKGNLAKVQCELASFIVPVQSRVKWLFRYFRSRMELICSIEVYDILRIKVMPLLYIEMP